MEADETTIHPSACVSPEAELGPGVRVGPYAILEGDCRIGAGCRVDAHAVIGTHTRLGRNNHLHHHAVVGTDSQDRKFQGETSYLEVGDDNVFREFCTVNRATREGASTRIGNRNLLLAYSHVAHNCRLGDGNVLANGVQVGGEVLIEDNVVIGGLVGIHQFCHIGRHAIVGSSSKVNQDILPYTTADGHPARPRGLNLVGLQRHGFDEQCIEAIRQAYKTIFFRGHSLEGALEALRGQAADNEPVRHILAFAESSERGLARARSLGGSASG